jgi:excisionase family DNA binding protein
VRVRERSQDSTTREPEPAVATGPEVPSDVLLLTVEQAARLLQISRSGVYALVRSGALRSVQLGGLRRVVRSDLLAFIEELRTVGGAGDAPDPAPGGEVGGVAHVYQAEDGGRAPRPDA